MKIVIAIIKPDKLDKVSAALTKISVQGMTVTEVKGYGRQRGPTKTHSGTEYPVRFMPEIKIEVAVPMERVDLVIETIETAVRNGQVGDGEIFVVDLEQAIRMRSGETDSDAI
jgi:nitrogen regulatory protein P-II 2